MKRRKRANETKRRRRKPASIKQQRIAAYRRRSGPRFQANKELRRTDFAAQRLAISGVLRTIASSPHDPQPILQTIIDSISADQTRARSVLSRKLAFVSLHLN